MNSVYSTLPQTQAEIRNRIDDLRNSGKLRAQPRTGKSGQDVINENLDDIERRALQGDVGARGEIAALERKIFGEGQSVELIPGTEIQGRTRPDMRVPGDRTPTTPRELVEVKTTDQPRNWERWLRDQVNAANAQVKRSGLRVGRPGAGEIQLFGHAAADFSPLSADQVERIVKRSFNPSRGTRLGRVSIFLDGNLAYEFVRQADGGIVRAFP